MKESRILMMMKQFKVQAYEICVCAGAPPASLDPAMIAVFF